MLFLPQCIIVSKGFSNSGLGKFLITLKMDGETKASIYFISDAHLGVDSPPEEEAKQELLISFLEAIVHRAEKLYIVGDLFDFWFEYRTVIPNRHHKILGALSDLVEAGTRVVYVAGNHDFWIGSFLTGELGLEVSTEPISTVEQGLKLFIAHGDGLAKKRDVGYRILRKILRNPINVWLFRAVHPDIGIPCAKFFSGLSRRNAQGKDLNAYSEECRQAAISKLAEGFDAVIIAHTHQSTLEGVGGKIYLNIGDWMKSFTYGKLNGGKLTLERWGEGGKVFNGLHTSSFLPRCRP